MKKLLIYVFSLCAHAENNNDVARLLKAIQSPAGTLGITNPERLYPQNTYKQVTQDQGICRGCDFSYGQSLRGKNVSGFDFEGSTFEGADLTGTIFIGAKIHNCNFKKAILVNADFSAASALPSKIRYLEQNPNNNYNNFAYRYGGSSEQIAGQQRPTIFFDEADLTGAKAVGARLQHASFKNTHLERTNFTLAQLDSAKMENAYLEKTILRGADVRNVQLHPIRGNKNMLDEKEQAKLIYFGDAQTGTETFSMPFSMNLCCTQIEHAQSPTGFHIVSAFNPSLCNEKDIQACAYNWQKKYRQDFNLPAYPSYTKINVGLPSWFKVYDNLR